ncbi:MAG: anaerobic ribonucleoside-triphosphate reductase activating protein [Treponema sp. CETP13]|nr:MAG: anaerobic ribonucleoside-triphosphate reductase activating protein [Treponema sp. CETP13]
MIRGVLVKTTLVDYPGKVAAAYFMSGCNLYCPYCYNVELVENTLPNEDSTSPKEVIAHLQKRKAVLGGITLSGGEPLIHKELPEFIAEIKKIGISVKLDTNGMLPERLEQLFEKPETTPNFVALDVKTAPERYKELARAKESNINYTKNIQQSISIVSRMAPENREFRTVLVPPLIASKDIEAIAQLLPKDASWQFAEFRAENCINKAYNSISTYTNSEVESLISQAKAIIPNAKLR